MFKISIFLLIKFINYFNFFFDSNLSKYKKDIYINNIYPSNIIISQGLVINKSIKIGTTLKLNLILSKVYSPIKFNCHKKLLKPIKFK